MIRCLWTIVVQSIWVWTMVVKHQMSTIKQHNDEPSINQCIVKSQLILITHHSPMNPWTMLINCWSLVLSTMATHWFIGNHQFTWLTIKFQSSTRNQPANTHQLTWSFNHLQPSLPSIFKHRVVPRLFSIKLYAPGGIEDLLPHLRPSMEAVGTSWWLRVDARVNHGIYRG